MCVLTHFIMNGMSYCINSLVRHVSDTELRCVSVRALQRLYVFTSITHSLIYSCTLKHRETEDGIFLLITHTNTNQMISIKVS